MLRRLLSAVFLLLFLTGCVITKDETNPGNTEYLSAEQVGRSEYSCVTSESETHDTKAEEGTVYTKAFTHEIYNSEKEYMVTLTTTITASNTGSGFALSSIKGDLTDAESDGLTVSEHISGNTGTVILYLNQLSVCHFQYRVSADGSFERLSE